MTAQHRAVTLFARSGGIQPVNDVDGSGPATFKKAGYNVGAGVGVQLSRLVSIRSDITFAENALRSTHGLDGDRLRRFFYDAAMQLQDPSGIGLTPNAYGGVGVVTLDQSVTTVRAQTKVATTSGLGVNYLLAKTGLGFFIEGQGWTYKIDKSAGVTTSDRSQLELAWSGGLTYRIRRS